MYEFKKYQWCKLFTCGFIRSISVNLVSVSNAPGTCKNNENR